MGLEGRAAGTCHVMGRLVVDNSGTRAGGIAGAGWRTAARMHVRRSGESETAEG